MQTPAVRNAIVHAVLAQKKLCFFEKSKIFLRLSENVTHKEDIGNSASRTCWTAEKSSAFFEKSKIFLFYVCRTGGAAGAGRAAPCQWSQLHVQDSSYKTVFHHFNLWSKARIFENVFYETVKGRAPIGGALAVDTSFVKNVFGKEKKQSFFARQSRAVTGRNPTDRGRKATKVSLLTDHRGTPLCSVFHKANKSDILTLKHLLDTSSRKTNQLHAYNALMADKGYDSATCRATCDARNLLPLIPRRGTTDTCRGRYVIEQTFGILDQFRRIRVRYEMLIRNFKSFHFLAMLTIISSR